MLLFISASIIDYWYYIYCCNTEFHFYSILSHGIILQANSLLNFYLVIEFLYWIIAIEFMNIGISFFLFSASKGNSYIGYSSLLSYLILFFLILSVFLSFVILSRALFLSFSLSQVSLSFYFLLLSLLV